MAYNVISDYKIIGCDTIFNYKVKYDILVEVYVVRYDTIFDFMIWWIYNILALLE